MERKSIRTWGVMLLSAGWCVLLTAACGTKDSDSGANCPSGEEGCSCYANETCDESLNCLSGLCVDATAEDGPNGSGGTDGSGGSDVSGSGGGNGENCDCDEEESCQDGECYPWECEPDEDFCLGEAVHACAADGLSSEEVESCGAGQYCDGASASCQDGVCEPDQPACDGNNARWCNAEGTGYVAGGTTCGSNATCDAGECKAHVCAPGEGFCQGQQVRACAENGLSSTVEGTCENQTCVESAGSASCQGVCAPMQTQCSGNGVQTCNANGQYGSTTACGATTPFCYQGGCTATPPSCQELSQCNGESCCTSLPVTGTSNFYRGYDSVSTSTSYPATVANFRLDKYEVTVGRFRKFVDAVVGGWRPAAGSGKHSHLNSGNGLVNSGTGGGYEPGWNTTWNGDDTTYRMHAAKASWDTSLACSATWQTWTASAAGNENRPINCVNWYQSQAFCIWDGGFLPSEAEWNYAAAGGTQQRYYPWSSPANSTLIDCTYANYRDGTGADYCVQPGTGSTSNVGSLSPKGNGRYGQSDLAGNVWEWTLDWYVSPYQTPCNNCASTTAASGRVFRGGSLSTRVGRSTSALSSSFRSFSAPGTRSSGYGLRCARTP